MQYSFMVNRILFLTVFSFIVLLFYECGNKNNNFDTRTVFRYNESSGITTLDPAFAKDQAHIWVCNQIYNGLVQFDDSLLIRPCIAKSWSISDDGLLYTFLLRSDVYFHNHHLFGPKNKRKVVANDFVYSFNRLLDHEIASPGAWIFNDIFVDTEGKYGFYAINDSLLSIKLKQAFPPFLSLLAMQYCSVVPHEVCGYYKKDFRKNAIGTGPFQLKFWKEGNKLVLTRNPEYFETENNIRLPYLDAVAISFVVDKQSAFLEFIRGNFDFMSGLAPSYINEMLTKRGTLNPKYLEKLNLSVLPYLNTEYLGILMDNQLPDNKNNPLLKKEVRLAINYGFDRKKMIKFLRNNIGTPGIYGIVPPGMPYFDTCNISSFEYNPDKAADLLAKAGYPNGKGLPEISLSTTSSYLDLCEFIQHQLGELGIKIKIDVNPPATLREMVAKSKLSFFRASWIADYPDMENYLSLFYSRNFCPQGPNYTHFKNSEFDELFEKSRTITDVNLRAQYYHRMNEILMEEVPFVVLYYDMVLRFTNKNISGLGNNAMNLLVLKRVKKNN